MITYAIALFITATPCFGQLQQTSSPQPKPVTMTSGTVKLTPANSRIDFVGTHEGAKPDPRKGGFAKFAGSAEVADTGMLTSVAFDIDTSSLWTEIPRLTGHLKSPDFFDVRQHPKASFRSSSVAASTTEGQLEISGTFTLHGVTKDIKIPAMVSVTPSGMTLVSKFKLDRTQFGMTYGEGKVKKDVLVNVVIGEGTPQQGK